MNSSMNYLLLVDHNGLLMYNVDPRCLGSFRHDLIVLKNSWVERSWRNLFTINCNDYCECVLGDPRYSGLEKYKMSGFNKTSSKIKVKAIGFPVGLVKTFNKMHFGHRVEWGID